MFSRRYPVIKKTSANYGKIELEISILGFRDTTLAIVINKDLLDLGRILI